MSPSSGRPARKASLTCAECRRRHLKCDGNTPICSRCHQTDSTCTYLPSLRGRQTRHQRARAQHLYPKTTTHLERLGQASSPSPFVEVRSAFLYYTGPTPDSSGSTYSTALSNGSNHASNNGSNVSASIASSSMDTIGSESLLDLYYRYFHDSHPCALPPIFLREKMDQNLPGMDLLVSVMRYIGSIYSPTVPSAPLKAKVTTAMAQEQPWASPFEVQAIILYSIAAFWIEEVAVSEELLRTAIAKALSIGMHKKEFVVKHSEADPVVAESWRRTWWQIYSTDIHIAATIHRNDTFMSTENIHMTVELPCEEQEYSSGNIPEPKTLEDYDSREFAVDDTKFSSYGYLIGLLRSFDRTIFGISRETVANVRTICSNTDASNVAWGSWLAKSKKRLIDEDGKVDELLFQASTLIQAYTINIHRELSKLSYSSIESISSCSPRPPPERLEGIYAQESHLHTLKVLQAIEKMTDLLTLPTDMAIHTPFEVCIIATITIAHLSACKFWFKGRQLHIARERVRVAISALETLGEIWPRTQLVVQEVKTIARELLFVNPEDKIDTLSPLTPPIEAINRLLVERSVPEDGFFSKADLAQYLSLDGQYSVVGSVLPESNAETGSSLFPGP